MPTTYLDLTNKLLRRLNEVTIPQADFASARNVQAVAKDAIIASIERINQAEREWPFNAELGSQLLVVGQNEYDFPADLRSIKWDSFHIEKDDDLGVSYKNLHFVSRDYWDDYWKDKDYDSIPDGLDVPNMVFEKHGYGFGVSPNPNEAYTVKFEYFAHSPTLSAYSDVSTIPTVFDEVIIQGGIYHFYMFRGNVEQASMSEDRFKRELREMRTNLIDKDDRIRSGMVVRPKTYAPTGFALI